jgi:hypothetical protein
MKPDEGFNADNPYHSVAMIYAGFLCDACGEYFPGEPNGGVDNSQVPYRIMAETAQRKGWVVKDRDPARYDYSVLCPECNSREETRAAR